MNNKIIELVVELLSAYYPVKKMRIDKSKHYSMKTKGNFKRAIQIGDTIYWMTNTDQKYVVMKQLSNVICRIFNLTQDESIPPIKKHLHIK